MQVPDSKEERESDGQPNFPATALGMLWWNGYGSQVPQPSFCTPLKSLFIDHSSRVPGIIKQGVIPSQCVDHSTTQGAGHTQPESEDVIIGTTRMQSIPIQSGM